ncbi:MAG: ABC transporter permease [Nostocoides sp.]
MSAPAAPMVRVAAQARFEAATLLRNGEQLLVALILPAMALVGLTSATAINVGATDSGLSRIDVVAPGVLALAVISTAFTGQAISTGFDRRAGVLRLLGTTPLGRGGLLIGRIAAVLVVEAVQFVILGGLALALGWRPVWSGLPLATVWWLAGSAALVALAFLVAGMLRAEAVLALANLLWVVMLGLGVVIPVATLPDAVEPVARLCPGGALGELLRSAFTGSATPWFEAAVLAIWAILGGVLAARTFRWSD